jgi:cation transport ATPase
VATAQQERQEKQKSARASKRLTWHEIVAMAGAVLLAIGLFLPWYKAEGPAAEIVPGQRKAGDFTGWEVHDIQRWLLLAAAVAPFILAYIVVRGHSLSWARGEMTAVTSIAAFGFIVYDGVIDRPGEVSGLVGLQWGWFVPLAGVVAMLVGSALRASEVERARKPPGVL